MAETLLEVSGVRKHFGGVTALDGVSVAVAEREILAIIGPNGAGKTTLFNLISRIFAPDGGTLTFAGRRICSLPQHTVARLGIARTFQNLQLFGHMSVHENVMVGAHTRGRAEMLAAALRLPSARREDHLLRERAHEALRVAGLQDLAAAEAAALSVGQQRLLEVARALAMRPLLLLLDEPAAGLTTRETATLAALVRRLRDELGITVVLIEHDMSMVMGLSDRVVVLDHGARIADGTPSEVQRDPAVIAAYLGEESAEPPTD